MATNSFGSSRAGKDNGGGGVLGRSAATGGWVLKPASKPGGLSMRKAKAAVERVLQKKA
jgi:hypothetical protein